MKEITHWPIDAGVHKFERITLAPSAWHEVCMEGSEQIDYFEGNLSG
jgi:hypothetical protein